MAEDSDNYKTLSYGKYQFHVIIIIVYVIEIDYN